MFYPGQKVVCVGDFGPLETLSWVRQLDVELPVRGQIYTVRKIVQRPCGEGETGYGILLEEILNLRCSLHKLGEGGFFESDDPNLFHGEPAFSSADFRPLLTVEDFLTAQKREVA